MPSENPDARRCATLSRPTAASTSPTRRPGIRLLRAEPDRTVNLGTEATSAGYPAATSVKASPWFRRSITWRIARLSP